MFVECAGHGRSIASDNMSGNISDHSGGRLSRNGNNDSLYLHDLKNVVKDYCYVAYAFNNDKLFFKIMLSRLGNSVSNPPMS